MYKTARLEWSDHIVTFVQNALWDEPKQIFTIEEFKRIMWPTADAVLNILVEQGHPSVEIYC